MVQPIARAVRIEQIFIAVRGPTALRMPRNAKGRQMGKRFLLRQARVTATNSSSAYVGRLAGYAVDGATIINSYSTTGAVTGGADDYVGGNWVGGSLSSFYYCLYRHILFNGCDNKRRR